MGSLFPCNVSWLQQMRFLCSKDLHFVLLYGYLPGQEQFEKDVLPANTPDSTSHHLLSLCGIYI